MRELRKKQKALFKIMKTVIIFAAIFIFVYIGAEPYVAKLSNVSAMVIHYVCDILVLGTMVLIFTYYSKYGKSDSFLTTIEYELSDYGNYITSREESTVSDFSKAMQDDFIADGFSVDTNVEVTDFEFTFRVMKRKEFFYSVNIENADKNDVLAYLDCVITDVTVNNLKRAGSAVLCVITDNAEESAISLSKMITPIDKKGHLKIAIVIVEPESKKCYFLGNMVSKSQQIIANYVLNVEVPIAEKYKGEKHLPFQDELENRMKNFTIKEFKDGTFDAH